MNLSISGDYVEQSVEMSRGPDPLYKIANVLQIFPLLKTTIHEREP